jgi:hypothetical protein
MGEVDPPAEAGDRGGAGTLRPSVTTRNGRLPPSAPPRGEEARKGGRANAVQRAIVTVHSQPGWTGGGVDDGSADACLHALHGVPEGTHTSGCFPAESIRPRWKPDRATSRILRSASSVRHARNTLDAADCRSRWPSPAAFSSDSNALAMPPPNRSAVFDGGVGGRFSLVPMVDSA